MSLVEDLADRLRATRDQLPVAEIAAAAERMRAAGSLLAWVLHESSKPIGLPGLGVAANHLDHAAAALRVAQDCMDDYCLALGVQLESYPDSRMPTVPSQVQRAESIDGQLTDWWSARRRARSGSTPSLSGPEHSSWRRDWTSPEQRPLTRRRRRWPN